MKSTIALLAAVIVGAACSTAYALYQVTDTGTWPKSWPAELEPLRKQSRTLVGPMAPHRHYAIRFTTREAFESAWPHILKVKNKGAPVFLVRGPNFFLGEHSEAGVVVHCPPLSQADDPGRPEVAIPGVINQRMRWINTTYVELVVDGEIVDLNRIPLPANAPLVDERFKETGAGAQAQPNEFDDLAVLDQSPGVAPSPPPVAIEAELGAEERRGSALSVRLVGVAEEAAVITEGLRLNVTRADDKATVQLAMTERKLHNGRLIVPSASRLGIVKLKAGEVVAVHVPYSPDLDQAVKDTRAGKIKLVVVYQVSKFWGERFGVVNGTLTATAAVPIPQGAAPQGTGSEAETATHPDDFNERTVPEADPLTVPHRPLAQVMAPDGIIKEKPKGKVRVEFEVTEVGIIRSLAPQDGETEPPILLSPGGKNETADRFHVIVLGKAVRHLKRLGIQDPVRHLRGKTVRVMGTVQAVPRDKGTDYDMLIESLDQFEAVQGP